VYRLVIVCLLSFAALAACQFSQFNRRKGSQIIVIMVENLGVQQINCSHSEDSSSDTTQRSGISLMCRESIRFTHAFTTSPMSGPAMASLLTGQYPMEHGLRHHGLSFLPASSETLPEKAQSLGFSTAFFSGGAPALRKYNLQQGFDLFDDSINLSQNNVFRNFEQSLELFKDWLKENGRHPYLSFFYVPDLLFSDTPTQSDQAEARDLTFESQLAEFDENLFHLVQSLKKNGSWDQSVIILAGLNGPAQYPRPGELDHTSLFSDRTQVGLLIKPAQKPRDEGLNWTFDQNVNLADLGKTLFELIHAPSTDSKLSDFPLYSLAPALENLGQEIPTRPLLLETAWADWQEKAGIRYGIRWDQFLFIFDDHLQIFNSLIDRFELSPMKAGEPGLRDVTSAILKLQSKNQLPSWPGISRDSELKWQSLSERLAHRLKNIPSIARRYSQELLKQQKWSELYKWADGMKLADYKIIAQMNLSGPREASALAKKLNDPCLRKDLKNCDDVLALHLLQWAKDSKSESSQKRFQRLFQQMKVDQTLSEQNLRLQGLWDISKETEKDLETTNMLLALPDMKAFR
jgi:hypothetical protein